MQRVILLVLFCGVVVTSLANLAVEDADHLFVARQWNSSAGLPQNSVNAIDQTADGYLWLGTFNGLVRFDGLRFTTFSVRNTPELRSDFINVLKATPDGRLWIGTQGGGLVHYQSGVFTRYGESQGLKEANILFILHHSKAGLWVGSMEHLYRFDGSNFHLVSDSVESDCFPFLSSAFDDEGNLWIATGKGIQKIEENKLVRQTSTNEFTHRVAIDPGNNVWYFREEMGLMKLTAGESVLAVKMSDWPSVMISSKGGQIWMGGNNNSLGYLENGVVRRFHSIQALKEYEVSAIYPDTEGNIWVGLDGGGLVRLRPKNVKTISVQNGLPSNNTIAIAEDHARRIWVGRIGSRSGMSWIIPQENRIQPSVSGWDKTWVSSFLKGRDGSMWIGTFGKGLWYWRDGIFQQRLTGPGPHTSLAGTVIRVLYEDKKGGFWIGTENKGAEYFHNEQQKRFSVAEGLSHNQITAITQDHADNTWIGTADGLNRISPDGTLTTFSRRNGLGVNVIHTVFVDRAGSIWVGTAGGGLSVLEGNEFITVTTREGLINDVVAQIIEDDFGDLWIGTNRGIARLCRGDLREFIKRRGKFIQCFAYGTDDGMINQECGGGYQPSCLKDANGQLWFCTVGGLVSIDPRAKRSATQAPKVYVEEIWLNGIPSSLVNTSTINDIFVIRSGNHSVEIKFTGISFGAPEQIRFRYKLENYDEDWLDAGTRRSAFYTKLPPGDYQFRVTASNTEGVWNEHGATLLMAVQPAWFQTKWFYSLLSIGLLGMVGGVYHWRIGQLKRERARKTDFSRRLIENQEAERQRISRELHDSLGLSFAMIKNHANLALNDTNSSPAVREHIQEICDVSSEAVQEVRQISHALRPPQIDRLGLTLTIETLATQMAKSGDLQLEMKVENLNYWLSSVDQINLLRIVQESLNNILKHARASSVHLSVKKEGAFMVLSIVDDGRGFDAAAVRSRGSGLGLVAMEERVEILGAQMEIRSVPGEGTRVKVWIPSTKGLEKS